MTRQFLLEAGLSAANATSTGHALSGSTHLGSQRIFKA